MDIDVRTLLTIIHLIGVALGAGGAFMSDAMFFTSAADLRFSRTELRFLRLGGMVVWTGLAVLVLSGAGLFLTDPERYLASVKFLVKITVIGVIIVNGIVFHALHIPMLHSHADLHFGESELFMRRRSALLASGALSVTSWVSAIVLGALSSVPWSYGVTMLIYLGIAATAMLFAVALRDVILPRKPGVLERAYRRVFPNEE